MLFIVSFYSSFLNGLFPKSALFPTSNPAHGATKFGRQHMPPSPRYLGCGGFARLHLCLRLGFLLYLDRCGHGGLSTSLALSQRNSRFLRRLSRLFHRRPFFLDNTPAMASATPSDALAPEFSEVRVRRL